MVILKYFEWIRICPDLREAVYELCTDKYKKVRQISKEEALQLIADRKLTRVARNKYGAIWK